MVESVVSEVESGFNYIGQKSFLLSNILFLMHVNRECQDDLMKIHRARFREDVTEHLPPEGQNLQNFIAQNYVFGEVYEIGQGSKKILPDDEGFYQHSDGLLALIIIYAIDKNLNAIDYKGSGSKEDVLEIHLENMIKQEKITGCFDIQIERV